MPEIFKQSFVAQGIHRLPEAVVLKSGEAGRHLPIFREAFVPNGVIVVDIVQHGRGKHEESAVDERAVALRFFNETFDLSVVMSNKPKRPGG